MSIIAARTIVRRVTRPLLLFWLFSQSMLLCAAGLGDHGHHMDAVHSAVQMVAADHSMHATSHGHADSVASSNPGSASADCCDAQDIATPLTVNLLLLLLLVLLMAPLYWLLPALSRSIRYLTYWREPSLRYNYPAYPILHCSLLN